MNVRFVDRNNEGDRKGDLEREEDDCTGCSQDRDVVRITRKKGQDRDEKKDTAGAITSADLRRPEKKRT